MKKANFNIIFIVLLFSFACNNQINNKFTFENGKERIALSLEKKGDSIYDLKMEIFDSRKAVFSDKWRLNYPVYRFDCEDINNDGLPEIAVGVIKTTRYDSVYRKRLFIFKIYDGKYIRPLWLGSRVGYPLIDFRIVGQGSDKRFRTIEQNGENSFVVAEYRYGSFGLEWICYIKKNIDKKTAEKLLNAK
ncbi:MAG: nuclear receptor-binding factor 2 [Paludibacter sp.]|nr:nuclear receptor-binding factor 2 [Paludibacter sp.]